MLENCVENYAGKLCGKLCWKTVWKTMLLGKVFTRSRIKQCSAVPYTKRLNIQMHISLETTILNPQWNNFQSQYDNSKYITH